MTALSMVRGIPLSEEPGLGSLTLPGFLQEVTNRYANREALVMRNDDCAERWSYADLWQRSVEVARALIASQAGKDTRVGVLMTNRPEWLTAVFGTTLAGGIAVPLSTFSTASELEYLLQTSSISILLFEGVVLKKDFMAMLTELEPAIKDAVPGQLRSVKFPFLRRLVVVGSISCGAIEPWPQLLARAGATPCSLVRGISGGTSASDVAALFFSSGSTARSKGIICTHRAIAIQLWRCGRLFCLDGDVRAWTPNGFFWSGNFATVLGTTLTCGGCLVLQRTFLATEALELLAAERVNFPMIMPHQAQQLPEAKNWCDVDLSAMRFVTPGTVIARHPTVGSLSWRDPSHTYGCTETFTLATGFPADVAPEETADTNGQVLPGGVLKIVDPISGCLRPVGESGEIALKGPTLMLGYLGVPTDETFDQEGFYHTGDCGRLDERRRLYFLGRLSAIIKTGGAKVSPIEVETILETISGVKAARVVGIPHQTLGEVVVACVVLNEGAALEAADIQRHARGALASYKVPRHVLFLHESEMTLTGSGKIKQGALRELAVRQLAV
jgi:fatty-acyl-CoA synthase